VRVLEYRGRARARGRGRARARARARVSRACSCSCSSIEGVLEVEGVLVLEYRARARARARARVSRACSCSCSRSRACSCPCSSIEGVLVLVGGHYGRLLSFRRRRGRPSARNRRPSNVRQDGRDRKPSTEPPAFRTRTAFHVRTTESFPLETHAGARNLEIRTRSFSNRTPGTRCDGVSNANGVSRANDRVVPPRNARGRTEPGNPHPFVLQSHARDAMRGRFRTRTAFHGRTTEPFPLETHAGARNLEIRTRSFSNRTPATPIPGRFERDRRFTFERPSRSPSKRGHRHRARATVRAPIDVGRVRGRESIPRARARPPCTSTRTPRSSSTSTRTRTRTPTVPEHEHEHAHEHEHVPIVRIRPSPNPPR
jgi:hypothetical protein